MTKRRIAVVGLGDIAQKAYLPILTALESVEITAVMSRTEATVRRIQDQYRIEHGFTDLHSVFRTEPEAVFIHSPTETHAGLVTECLRHGLHVYVDKPLSYDIRESESLAESAARYGRLLAVGFNRRFAPRYAEAKAWLEEAGGFEFAVAQKHRTRRQKHGAKQTYYDDLIHMLDLLFWLGGPDAVLSEDGSFVRTDEEGRLLHGSGCLKWKGAAGIFSMNRRAGSDLEKLELHGSLRSAEVVNLERAVFHSHKEGERAVSFGSWDSVLYRRGFTGAVSHFLDSLDRQDRCTIRAELVLPVHHLVERLPV